MKVKELITELQKFDPELKVIFYENGTFGITEIISQYDAVWIHGSWDKYYDEYQFNKYMEENKVKFEEEEKNKRKAQYEQLKKEFENN